LAEPEQSTEYDVKALCVYNAVETPLYIFNIGVKLQFGVHMPKVNARVMNRFCSYLWVVVLILVDKTRNLFDKFQTGCVWEVCVVTL
jgi:hypothetical protein